MHNKFKFKKKTICIHININIRTSKFLTVLHPRNLCHHESGASWKISEGDMTCPQSHSQWVIKKKKKERKRKLLCLLKFLSQYCIYTTWQDSSNIWIKFLNLSLLYWIDSSKLATLYFSSDRNSGKMFPNKIVCF